MFDNKPGVSQGCILCPFLFLIIIDFVMTKAMDDASFGIEWGQKRLVDLDFADDISTISHTLAGIQEITNNIETFGPNTGLRINCEKTKAMKIRPEQHHPTLIMQQNVDYVEKFPYLGSYMSSDGDSEPDVRARIGKAASIFQRLRSIWSSTTINLNVKLRLYSAIVIPTTMYACGTWKRTAMIAHMLDVFHRRCLRAILGIRWRDHVTNEEVMRRAEMERLQYIVTTRRGKMAGHVFRLQIVRPAHTTMYCVPEDGRRRKGRPKKTWRSSFKEDLEEMGVSWHGARRIASDRDRWRLLVARCSERYRRT